MFNLISRYVRLNPLITISRYPAMVPIGNDCVVLAEKVNVISCPETVSPLPKFTARNKLPSDAKKFILAVERPESGTDEGNENVSTKSSPLIMSIWIVDKALELSCVVLIILSYSSL